MDKLFFTPGPAQPYFTVEQHIKNALRQNVLSISHRGDAFSSIVKNCVNNLRQIFGINDDYQIFFTSSATEVWERITQNLIEKESYHFVNGVFSNKFYQTVLDYNKKAGLCEVEQGNVVDINQVNIDDSVELISLAYNETSTGACHTAAELESLRTRYNDKLIALDVVSISPSIKIDFNQVDTFYLSVQKCFGLPSGLGVWVLNNRCIEKAKYVLEKNKSIGSYHSISSFLKHSKKFQTPSTPNILGIYLLEKVSHDMLEKGLDKIYQETNYKASVLTHAINESPYLDFLVKNSKHRSKTIFVANTSVHSNKIINALEKKGLVIGKGYGEYKEKRIRISNFPTHSKEQMHLLSDNILSLRL